jgi:molybdate transport repressor ModE-like protein
MFRPGPSMSFTFRPWMVCDTRVEIRELRAFAVVAEEGSLSAAARRLHLSQSALSQTIQSLERQLGVQLLLRSRTGVSTTEAGAILLREGRALIAQYDRMLAAVPGRDAAGPGLLKVGIPLELPADLLPGVLTELSTEFPLTRVEVSHASSAAQLRKAERPVCGCWASRPRSCGIPRPCLSERSPWPSWEQRCGGPGSESGPSPSRPGA